MLSTAVTNVIFIMSPSPSIWRQTFTFCDPPTHTSKTSPPPPPPPVIPHIFGPGFFFFSVSETQCLHARTWRWAVDVQAPALQSLFLPSWGGLMGALMLAAHEKPEGNRWGPRGDPSLSSAPPMLSSSRGNAHTHTPRGRVQCSSSISSWDPGETDQ